MTRPITEDELDIDKMVETTGIPSYKIRRAFEFPLSAIEECFADMLKCAITPAAITRIILIVEPETTVGRRGVRKLIHKSHTRKEVLRIFRTVPSYHSEMHRAYEKLVEVSGNENPDGEDDNESGADPDSDPATADSKRCLRELLEANTIIPVFSTAEELLIVKIAKFFADEENGGKVDVERMAEATNIAESSIRAALKLPLPGDEERIASLMAQCNTRADLIKLSAVIQWRSVLGLQAARQQIILSNRDERIALARSLPDDSPARSEAYAALLADSTTPEEVWEIYEMIPETRAADEDKAIIRLAEFFLKPKTDKSVADP